jgi:hypothetical protein
LSLIAEFFLRQDLPINPHEAPQGKAMTSSNLLLEMHELLWRQAECGKIPGIGDLIRGAFE